MQITIADVPPFIGLLLFTSFLKLFLDDCFWDFVSCSKTNTFYSNESPNCCQLRYDACCQFIMVPHPTPPTPPPTPPTRPPTPPPTPPTPTNLSK